MNGKYLYGILDGNVELAFSSRGLFNKRPYLIYYDAISAIVTDAPIRTYEADQQGLLSHNQVLEEVIKLYTVLPMRFGTIAHSEDEVKDLLQNAYEVLRNRLLKIKDKVEFNLEIILNNEQSIIPEILAGNKEIQELRNRLMVQGQEANMQDKITIGKMVAEEVLNYKSSLVKAIDLALKPYYWQCKLLTRKDILANMALVVDRSKIKEFESAIYKLGERYGDKLKFKYAGPLAPYSFVELSLILINFDKVNAARRQLGLGDKANLNEIKEAYRKLAHEYHPDKNPGDSLKEEEFKKIASAYKLLYEYCRHYPRSLYIFRPEEIAEISVMVENNGD